MRVLMLAAIMAATAVSAQAEDTDAEQRADLRCFIGMTVMARNETYKSWAQFGMFFYTGRIKGRDPGIDLAAALKREYPHLREFAMNEEIRRCSEQLGQVSRDLEGLKREAPRGVGR